MKKTIFVIIFCCIMFISCKASNVIENSVTSLENNNSSYELENIKKSEIKVKNDILKIESIKDCTVYITGDTALIGVISDNSDRNDEVKEKIINTAKDDGKIKYVSVTFNKTVFDMIEKLKNK